GAPGLSAREPGADDRNGLCREQPELFRLQRLPEPCCGAVRFLMRQQLTLVFASAAIAVFLASSSSFGEEQKDREFKECGVCPVMVGIPGGNFIMGSPETEAGRFDAEGPQHPVSVRAFALGKFPVTSEEFLTFLKDTGYQPRACNPLLN